jgi:hypothetical protein
MDTEDRMTPADLRGLLERALPGGRLVSADYEGHAFADLDLRDVDVITITRVVATAEELEPPIDVTHRGTVRGCRTPARRPRSRRHCVRGCATRSRTTEGSNSTPVESVRAMQDRPVRAGRLPIRAPAPDR